MVQIDENQAAGSTLSGGRFSNRAKPRIGDRVARGVESRHPRARLANDLASEFWARLAFSRLADEAGYRSIEQIMRIASASHSQIVAWYGECVKMVEAVCRAAIELRGDLEVSDALRQRLAGDFVEEMKAKGVFPLPPRPFVDYKVAELEPAVAMEQAERELESLCLQLANQFFGLLDRLQQKDLDLFQREDQFQREKLLGSVEHTNSTCRFTFCRRVAIIKKNATKREHRKTVDPRFADHWHKAYFVDTYDVSLMDVQHRHALHVHDVRHPALRDVGQTKYPLPEKYRELIRACPDWIRPSLRVLEGDLIQEQQFEWDLSSETLVDEQLVGSRWERCPAIVLGDYVLAGWGEQAIAGEEGHIREQQAETEKSKSIETARRCWLGSVLLGVLAVAMILFSPWAAAIVTPLAILIGIAAMFMASRAAHRIVIAHNRFSTFRVLSHSLLVGCTVFTVQAFLFSVLHLSLPALALAALFAIAASICFTLRIRKNRDGELEE